MRKYLSILCLAACLVLVACGSSEKHSTKKIEQPKQEKKADTKKSTKVKEGQSDEKSKDSSTNNRKYKDFKSTEEYITHQFESQSINNDQLVRDEIIRNLTESRDAARNSMSLREIANRYFMSELENVDKYSNYIQFGYDLDFESLIIHNTNTEGVQQWIITLKRGSRTRYMSGYRNQLNQMPIVYLQ